MYAEIAVNVSLGPWTGGQGAPPPAYHYRVPTALAAAIAPGQLVRVPFGARPAQGIVLSLTETAPILPNGAKIRPLDAIADPRPVLAPAHLALARWIADTTLSPLADVVWAMVPSGLEEKAHVVVELVAGEKAEGGRRKAKGSAPLAAGSTQEVDEEATEGERRPTTHDPRPPTDDELPATDHQPATTGDTPTTDHQRPTTDDRPLRLGPVQQAIVNALTESGPLRLDDLTARVGGKPTSALNSLVERGLVRRTWALDPPTVRPRTVRVVVLTATPSEVEAARPTLGRDTPEARALAWLAACGDPLPSLAALQQASGASAGAIQRLAAEGVIGVTGKRTLLALRVSRVEAAASPHKEGKVGPALGLLLASPVPLDLADLKAQGVTAPHVKRLVEAGLVQRIEEEPSVYLTIPLDHIPDALVRLRKADGQAHALAHLLAHGPEMDAATLAQASQASLEDLRALEARGLLRIEERPAWRDPLAGQSFALAIPPHLTDDQARAWAAIEAAFDTPGERRAFLLHGVTGSGKTELYLRGVAAALARGQQALILVPEIALTPQTVRRFAARFPGRVTVWHSKLTPGQRYDTWQRVRAGEIDVVIGSRSALFAPLSRLGLIVVDEEHEPSYKQDATPRYHAREGALRLGRETGAVVLLGSATPDVETYARAEQGELTLLTLPRRVVGHRAMADRQATMDHGRWTVGEGVEKAGVMHAGPTYGDLPPVQVVDLRAELRAGNTSVFSRALQAALAETLARREQAILFLNRRGAATFVMCRDCGHVLACPRCSTPLTYHTATGALVCHHCGQRQTQPRACPKCGSERVKHFGAGTQRVEEALLALFPQARVLRWDSDTTGGRTAHAEFLDAFLQGDADVLVGTQMIAKGLDLPLVTLVGVVSADTGLHLPDFRAAERTFQLLTQVAGRAARGPLGGRVIFQTYTPEHYAIQAAARHDYLSFYATEMEFRRAAAYPPYTRLARLLYLDPTWERARAESETLARRLTDYIRRQGLTNTSLIGPAPAYFSRERGEYRWHIVVRSPDPAALLRAFFQTARPPYGWRIDMDPVSLL